MQFMWVILFRSENAEYRKVPTLSSLLCFPALCPETCFFFFFFFLLRSLRYNCGLNKKCKKIDVGYVTLILDKTGASRKHALTNT